MTASPPIRARKLVPRAAVVAAAVAWATAAAAGPLDDPEATLPESEAEMLLVDVDEAELPASQEGEPFVFPEEIGRPGVVDASLLDTVSARAADGLRVEDFAIEEIPRTASSGRWFSSGQWYGSAEVLCLNRSRNYRRVIGYDPSVVGIANPSLRTNHAGTFTTTGVPFDIAPAARLTIGEHLGRDDLDRDQSLEFTYYGGLSVFLRDNYKAMPNSYLVTPLSGTILPGLPGFTFAQSYEATNGSTFNGMEVNYKLGRRLGRDQLVMSPNGGWTRHAERGWLPALIVGTRVANVNESFTLASSRTGVSAGTFSGNYGIQTQNWLWGLNIGGELISQNESYYWGLRGRATPAVSFAGSQQAAAGINTLPAPPPPALVSRGAFAWKQNADQIGAGFLGDLTLLAGWQVTPNFAVQAGYDFLWIGGIATATRQFNLDNVRPNAIDAGGQVFYNGLSLGIEGSW